MRAALQAETIRQEELFAALEPEWWELWRRVSSATPFQSPAWLIPWWRHFHPGELFVVTVRQEGRLVGLAPFYVEEGTRRILPVGISVSDYLDVLIEPGHEASAGRALVEQVAVADTTWHEWSLEELAPDAVALSLPAPPHCEELSSAQSACPVLDLPKAATIWDVVPARPRRDTNLARNRAARRGDVRIDEVGGADGPAFLDALFRLHEARWRSRGEAGVLADERVRRFQQEVLPRLMNAGLARCYVLGMAGRAAAVHYGLMHRRRAYAYLLGFDPDFAFESPGVILMAHAIERALAEDAREFHFLRGPEAYKYAWGATDRWNRRRSFRRVAGRLAS
ncbi:MAG: GNAT family N-acetyltransferase [Pseudomonadota bacterium]|nr:GNAT family N-acetyltransferase [Pseudomonadota bacterium]